MSDLQEQVLADLAKGMEQSIDFVVLCDVLRGFGWTVLDIEYDPESEQTWSTIKNWADENFAGDYREHQGTWLIELAKDATMFALRWKVRQ